MTALEQMQIVNQAFVQNLSENFKLAAENVSKVPRKKLAILTCMDTRLVEFLEPALGIKREDAVVIKNAGNSVTGSFEATIRSLVIAIFELGIQEIMVIGHEDCGVAHSTAQAIIEKMRRRGISYDAIKMIKDNLETWLDNFHHPHDNVLQVVEKIKNNPLIPVDVPVHGLIFEPHTGEISILKNGYQE
ncbi:beta-class carbonic anhydrase [Sporomusa aerivorans]|uniref:beta-class carbonic anhydrase n=1 Tax=Sporomusa aerivorans TaxID=204936 RepID=UPI00352B02C7